MVRTGCVGIDTGYKLFQGHLPSIKIVNTNPLDLTLPLLGILLHKSTKIHIRTPHRIISKSKILESCLSSVAQSCLTLCNPMDCSTPGLPVHRQLLELAQTHVHRVSDAIQPSHLLLSPSPPAFNLSQHQGFFQWVSSSHQVAKALELQLQHQSFQWIFRTDLLQNGLVGSPCSPRDSQESSPTPQFKSINSSVLSFLYSSALTSMHDSWEKTIALTRRTFVGNVSVF